MPDMPGLARIDRLDETIFSILKEYCRVPSITNTSGENLVPDFFRQCLASTPYFQANPVHLGVWDLQGDYLNRSVCWAMIRGNSEKTCVLLHHYDVVVTDNYGPLQDKSLDIEQLGPALKDNPHLLDAEARKDLFSDQWLFGRGVADMKGGGAIQLSLFAAYASLSPEDRLELPTLVLLAVPDEENLSAGMRGGLDLLCHLKEQYDLSYQLLVNSEPHQRLTPGKGLISQGSIGKLNLFVYARGVMAHAGKVLEGMNPTGLMARIVVETDLSDLFVDHAGRESSIPPTWMSLKDVKRHYDISFPDACYGMFNVLNFHTSPGQVLSQLIDICKHKLNSCIEEINQKRLAVSRRTGQTWSTCNWSPRVIPFGELKTQSQAPATPLPLEEELAFRTRGFFPEEPLIVVGFCPPYYPGVTNPNQQKLYTKVSAFTQEHFGQDYDNQAYYTGISDMSYAMATGDSASLNQDMTHMVGDGYHIPFDKIEKISMNCINIGPWGKDFHKPSERVLKEDLFLRTPLLIDHILRTYNT